MENKKRYGVAFLLCACLALFVVTPGATQLRNQRRVTALQLGEAAEGSRVTIVSDSALNDYEAFRRGDRFYVKIPLADFASGLPHLRADGFEDVQLQRVGDGLIVSFKLQPGATARVDQRGNRLDVIFSSPNRSSSIGNASRNRRVENVQRAIDRGPDVAGPIPPGPDAASRDPFVSNRTPEQPSYYPRALTNPGNAPGKSSKASANSKSAAGNAPVTSSSPLSSPNSAPTPRPYSSSAPVLGATPVATPAAKPGDSSTGTAGVSSWRRASAAAFKWVGANKMATMVGALILLGLILYLAMALRTRQKSVVKEKRAKAPKVQPKIAHDVELNELPTPPGGLSGKEAAVAADVRSEAISGADIADQPQSNSRKPQASIAPAAAANASQGHQWGLTKPRISAPVATPDLQTSEEEEREVFEL